MTNPIVETPVTGLPGRTPRENIEAPLTGGRKKEPILLVDASGSNAETAGPDSPMTKQELILTVLPLIVAALESDDAEAAAEQASGSSRKGGVRAFAFSDHGRVQDLDDLNSANVKESLAGVVWGGMTYIMDAVRASEAAFQDEFRNRPLRNRPAQELVILTDGKLSDAAQFEAWVAQADETAVVCVAVIGHGDAHDEAVEHYQGIAEKNPYVSVVALTGVSDPMEVAYDVRRLSGTGAAA